MAHQGLEVFVVRELSPEVVDWGWSEERGILWWLKPDGRELSIKENRGPDLYTIIRRVENDRASVLTTTCPT